MNNLLGLLFLFILTNIHVIAFAQQDFLLTGEGVRNFWYNPATIATFNRYSVNTSSRLSLINGFDNPYVVQIGAATKLTNLIAKHPRNEFGFGVNFSQDDSGSMQTKLITATLNYQLVLNKSRVVFGVAPGIRQMKFSWTPILPSGLPDPVTTELLSKRQIEFDLGVGINWYNERFSIGLSSTHVTNRFYNSDLFSTPAHYYVNGMYRFKLPHGINLKTVGTIRTDQSALSAQGMLFVEIPKNNISIGAGYRKQDAFLAGFSFRINKWYAGYFLDYSPNGIFSQISHEVRLAFELFDNRLMPFPAVQKTIPR